MTNHSENIFPLEIMQYCITIGGTEELRKYVNDVYRFLMNIKPGSRIRIDNIVKRENKKLFIEVVKMYQAEANDYSVQFNIDYEILRKKQPENAIH